MRRVLAAALAVAAAALTACGGGTPERGKAARPAAATKATTEPAAIQRTGSVAELADCGDWRRFSRAQRYEAIAEIRRALTPQRVSGGVSPVSDQRAYAVFDQACAPAYSSSLRLYKLYIRVKGFAPLAG